MSTSLIDSRSLVRPYNRLTSRRSPLGEEREESCRRRRRRRRHRVEKDKEKKMPEKGDQTHLE
jgi:hypothetical protein